MVAALPLVGRRVGGVLPVGGTTVNYWSPNGDLLLDPTGDTEAVLDLLIDGIEQLAVAAIVDRDGPGRVVALDGHDRRDCGGGDWPWTSIRAGAWALVNTEGDFDEYLASRSKNLRRSLGKDRRRLEQGGATRFRFDAPTADQVEARLREVFELEDRGWKGEAGGSVLSTPGMFEFYARQARRLAAWGDLRVAVLEHQGMPIAFDVGWLGKGVYHSYKVGYDPAYREFGPGHLLRGELIRHCFEHPAIRAVDFQGPADRGPVGLVDRLVSDFTAGRGPPALDEPGVVARLSAPRPSGSPPPPTPGALVTGRKTWYGRWTVEG